MEVAGMALAAIELLYLKEMFELASGADFRFLIRGPTSTNARNEIYTKVAPLHTFYPCMSSLAVFLFSSEFLVSLYSCIRP